MLRRGRRGERRGVFRMVRGRVVEEEGRGGRRAPLLRLEWGSEAAECEEVE